MSTGVVNRTVNIFIQSGEAQKTYDRLIEKQKKFNDELEKTSDPKKIQKLNAELDKLKEPIDRAAKKLSGELDPSLRDTQATAFKLRNELSRMSESDAGFHERVLQLQQANKELDAQKGKVGLLRQSLNSFWQEAKTVAVGVIIGNTVQNMLQTVVGYVTGIVSGSAKISDELADIQRVTGLTKSEVAGINSELSKIDTRTSVAQLREITKVAGMLGVSKGDIIDFVKATDMLSVALGDELGSVDQITSQLGKILNVFDGKVTAENITHLGNAIVDLSNKGVATGAFMVDFTQRLSGIAKASNLSESAVLGFAAGIEETGGRVESGATALQKIIVKIGEDVPKAARIAGAKTKEEIDKFATLFAKAPEEAILQFAQGLQKNKASFAEITSAFKDAGEDGARSIETLSKLGQNADVFRAKIKDAGEAIQDTGKITEAFRLKNETLGAQLDKLKKTVANVFASQSFKDIAQAVVDAALRLLNVLKSTFGFISDHKVLIASLSGAYLLFTTAINGTTIANLKNAVVTRVRLALAALERGIVATQVAAQLIYANVVDLVTKRITFATAATRIWQTVTALGAGPIGILLVAVGALTLGVQALFNRTKELTTEQKLNAEIQQKVNEATGDTVSKVELLKKVLQDANAGYAAKKAALDELIKINPDFINTLKLEADGHVKGIEAIDSYITALKTKAEAEAKYAVFQEKTKRRQELLNEFRNTSPAAQNLSDDALLKLFRENKGKLIGKVDDKVLEFDQVDQSVERLSKDMDVLAQATGKTKDQLKGLGTNAPNTGPTEGKLEALRKKLKDLQDQREKAGDDKSIASFNKQISETEEAIRKLEGGTTKLSSTEKKAAHDTKELEEELKKIALSLLPDDTPFQKFEKQIDELDAKYAKLREKAHNNSKLMAQIDVLFAQDRQKLLDNFVKSLGNGGPADPLTTMEERLKKMFEGIEQRLQNIPANLQGSAGASVLHDTLGRDDAAKAELEASKRSAKEQHDFKIDQLKKERDATLSNTNLTENERQNIIRKKNQEIADEELNFWISRIQGALDFAKQAADISSLFDQIKTNKENAELDRDKKLNDKKKANLDKRLKAGTLSQADYDRQVQKLEKSQEAREKELRLKQFKRDQKAQLVNAAINGAGAVLTTLKQFGPPFPPNFLGIGAMALTLITIGAQIAAISSKKPPEFARGGKLQGPLHKDGGVPVVKNGLKIAEAEGGEAFINRFSMRDKKTYTVSGTPSQIASSINALHGGIHWESGATLRPAWKTVKPVAMDFAGIRKAQHFAAGGVLGSTSNQSSSAENSQAMMMDVLVQLSGTVAGLQQQLSAGITAKMFLTEQEAQQDRLDRIRDDATMKR